ncbi:MAG TPA: hypothetical protein VKB34_14110 [Povalibacter sp.]|nr:hypothetical protein [Povalibacter sp.]
MQILRRSLIAPLHYWRTILLVSCVGFFVTEMFRDELAVMLCTTVCAFVFAGYERRRWISVSSDFHMGDVLMRLSLALAVTYWLSHLSR